MRRRFYALLLLGAAALVAAGAAAACGGDDDDNPPAPAPTTPATASPGSAGTPTAKPSLTPATPAGNPSTPTPPAPPQSDTSGCPLQFLVCDYAFALESAFVKSDWAAAAALFEGESFICPEPPATPPQGIPSAEMLACQGKAKGTKVQAVISGKFASEASVILVENLASELARRYGAGGRYILRAIGIPFRQECESCRRVVIADGARDLAIMVEIELRGPKWTGIRLLDGPASMLTSQPDRVGAKVTTYDETAKRWSNLVEVKSNRKEYDAVVAAGGDCLNLRETSSTNARVITCLPDATPVLVTEFVPAVVQGGVTWVQVQANKVDGTKWVGWASKEFVKPK